MAEDITAAARARLDAAAPDDQSASADPELLAAVPGGGAEGSDLR
jgi:hypothetical protein